MSKAVLCLSCCPDEKVKKWVSTQQTRRWWLKGSIYIHIYTVSKIYALQTSSLQQQEKYQPWTLAQLLPPQKAPCHSGPSPALRIPSDPGSRRCLCRTADHRMGVHRLGKQWEMSQAPRLDALGAQLSCLALGERNDVGNMWHMWL